MSIQVIRQYLEENFQAYLEPVSEICKNTRGAAQPLNSSCPMYNFDKISAAVTSKLGFSSADALRLQRNSIDLIEFKTGFRRNTTKENWDPKESKCYRDSTIDCEPFQDLFLKNVELELKVLRDSIRNKAIDSYITWDKCIMSQISIDHPIVLNYIVVIDGDDTDRIEDILSSVANKKAPRTNELARLKQSLSKYAGNKSPNKAPYGFNSINVYTFREYQQQLKV